MEPFFLKGNNPENSPKSGKEENSCSVASNDAFCQCQLVTFVCSRQSKENSGSTDFAGPSQLILIVSYGISTLSDRTIRYRSDEKDFQEEWSDLITPSLPFILLTFEIPTFIASSYLQVRLPYPQLRAFIFGTTLIINLLSFGSLTKL